MSCISRGARVVPARRQVITLIAVMGAAAVGMIAPASAQQGENLGGGIVIGELAFADPVPISGSCHATDFSFSGEAQAFVLNTVIAGYVGPLEVTGTAHDDCANGPSQVGTVSVSASGTSTNGSTLQCGPLTGSYVRVLTTGTIEVRGPCSVNGLPTGDIRFVGEAVVVPDGNPPFATARFAVPFSVFPDVS